MTAFIIQLTCPENLTLNDPVQTSSSTLQCMPMTVMERGLEGDTQELLTVVITSWWGELWCVEEALMFYSVHFSFVNTSSIIK